MYMCECCGISFNRKRAHESHSKKCHSMTIDKKSMKRRRLQSAVRFGVWNSAFGERNAVGQCYCCSREVTQQSFDAGHVKSVAEGGSDHVSNLRVVCRNCNLSMGTQDMEAFKTNHFMNS